MVVSTANIPKDGDVFEVVLVVEDTANISPYFDTLMKSYIIPSLEHFNNGPADPTDYGIDYCCSLYNIVKFHAADISPCPAASCTRPTNSIHDVILLLEKLKFVGGAGQSSSHTAEGLSTALQVFDDFKAVRRVGMISVRHCVLICNSPPYQIGAEESIDYNGFNSEQLASMMGKRGIFLSVISPRKIAALQKIFEAARDGNHTNLPMDCTLDPCHMVLLHGYQLQVSEVSHKISSEIEKIIDPNKLSHNINMSVTSLSQSDGCERFKVPSIIAQGQASAAVGQLMSQASNNISQSPVSVVSLPTVSPYTTQQQISHAMFSKPWQPSASQTDMKTIPMTNTVRGIFLGSSSHIAGIGNTAESTQGMVAVASRMTTSSHSHIAQPRHSASQGAVSGQVGSIPQTQVGQVGSILQTQVGQVGSAQRMPTSLHIDRSQTLFSGITGTSDAALNSSAMPMPDTNAPTIVSTDVTPSNLYPTPTHPSLIALRDRKIIWTGALEYNEKTKVAPPALGCQQQKITWLLTCRISISINEPDLLATNWPEKLSLQLLPHDIVTELHSTCRNSRQVAFHFSNNDQEALRNLHKLMGTGFAGCVHFPPQSSSKTRIILLLFSARKRAFVGLIPNDQSSFVQGIKNVLMQYKMKPKVSQQAAMFQHIGSFGPAMSQGQAVVMDTGVLSAGQNMTSVTTCASIGIGSGQSMMAGQSASQIQNIQLFEAKQRELQFQQQQQLHQQQQKQTAGQKNVALMRHQQHQQQMLDYEDYCGHQYFHYQSNYALNAAQQQQQQQQLNCHQQQDMAAQRMQIQQQQQQLQPNQQPLHHMLLSQQQQIRQQQMLLHQQQHGRQPVAQHQSGVMPPGGQAVVQGMQMGQMNVGQTGQGLGLDDFGFNDFL